MEKVAFYQQYCTVHPSSVGWLLLTMAPSCFPLLLHLLLLSVHSCCTPPLFLSSVRCSYLERFHRTETERPALFLPDCRCGRQAGRQHLAASASAAGWLPTGRPRPVPGAMEEREHKQPQDDTMPATSRRDPLQQQQQQQQQQQRYADAGPRCLDDDRDALDDALRGMMFAALSITDDGDSTLERVGKTDPWHVEAIKIVTGDSSSGGGGKEEEEEQRRRRLEYRPLSVLLADCMDGLRLDAHIDECGVSRGGHVLDTQGYVAHNDEVIVLSYRCTANALDWLTNLHGTRSPWRVKEDSERGFSGYCSGFEIPCCRAAMSRCCRGRGDDNNDVPRVHTGFYNNFLVTVPIIKRYIEPLLGPHQPPRKLFVVGHSLGAAIASVATCYFLLEYDWSTLPQKFCSVTAGCPRFCNRRMRDMVADRVEYLRREKKTTNEKQQHSPPSIRNYMLVNGRDIVARLPPESMGFYHIADPIAIDAGDGAIRIPRAGWLSDDEDEVEQRNRSILELNEFRRSGAAAGAAADDAAMSYANRMKRTPAAIRHHYPDQYLKPLYLARGAQIEKRSAATVAVPASGIASTTRDREEKRDDDC